MNANTKSSAKISKTTADKQSKSNANISPDYIVRRLNQDVRNSILVVSVLINVFLLIGWLVVEVSTRYDAALINYLQNK